MLLTCITLLSLSPSLPLPFLEFMVALQGKRAMVHVGETLEAKNINDLQTRVGFCLCYPYIFFSLLWLSGTFLSTLFSLLSPPPPPHFFPFFFFSFFFPFSPPPPPTVLTMCSVCCFITRLFTVYYHYPHCFFLLISTPFTLLVTISHWARTPFFNCPTSSKIK